MHGHTHLKAEERRDSTAGKSLLILVLIVRCWWVFILQFFHYYLYCDGSSVDKPDSIPSVSTTLTHKRKEHARTSRCVCLLSHDHRLSATETSRPPRHSIIPRDLLTLSTDFPLMHLCTLSPYIQPELHRLFMSAIPTPQPEHISSVQRSYRMGRCLQWLFCPVMVTFQSEVKAGNQSVPRRIFLLPVKKKIEQKSFWTSFSPQAI